VALSVLGKGGFAKKSARLFVVVISNTALSEISPTRQNLDVTKLAILGTNNGRFNVKRRISGFSVEVVHFAFTD
jgi:hypothetical protein